MNRLAENDIESVILFRSICDSHSGTSSKANRSKESSEITWREEHHFDDELFAQKLRRSPRETESNEQWQEKSAEYICRQVKSLKDIIWFALAHCFSRQSRRRETLEGSFFPLSIYRSPYRKRIVVSLRSTLLSLVLPSSFFCLSIRSSRH